MVLIYLSRFTDTSVLCYRYHFLPLPLKVLDKILEGVFEKPHDSSVPKYIRSFGQSATCFGLFGHHHGCIRRRKKTYANYNMDMRL